MENLTPEALEQAITAAGTNPTRLALEIGRDKDYIRDLLQGRKKSLKANDWLAIRERLGLDIEEATAEDDSLTLPEVSLSDELPAMPVVGTIQAGVWVETYMLSQDDQKTIPVGRDPRYPHARQYALCVRGDSMDEADIPDGSYVVCVDFAESGIHLRAGHIVHVESIEADKSETTLKEVAIKNGRRILIPRSSNPAHKAITMEPHPGLGVFVRGVVLSVFNQRRL